MSHKKSLKEVVAQMSESEALEIIGLVCAVLAELRSPHAREIAAARRASVEAAVRDAFVSGLRRIAARYLARR